jgi:hypothetical protein
MPKSKPKPKPKLSKLQGVVTATKQVYLTTDPLPPSAFSVGDHVHHRTFGEGKVLSIREDKLTIRFPSTTKEIREDFVDRKR